MYKIPKYLIDNNNLYTLFVDIKNFLENFVYLCFSRVLILPGFVYWLKIFEYYYKWIINIYDLTIHFAPHINLAIKTNVHVPTQYLAIYNE